MLQYPFLSPFAFQLGPVSIRWYSILCVIGFFTAMRLGFYRIEHTNSPLTKENFIDLGAYLIVGIILGARLFYVLFYNLDYFIHYPQAALKIWEGGLSFHGGLLGALFVLKRYSNKYQKDFIVLNDFIAPLVPIGLGAGRIGNFINGELWGRITQVPWGMVFPYAGPDPRHPSQLYEALLEGFVLFIALWVYSRKRRAPGSVSGLFAVLYSLFRFAIEFLREPDESVGFIALGWLTMGQLLTIPLLIGGVMLCYSAYKKR